jgi:predicted nucleic acid-binding protein
VKVTVDINVLLDVFQKREPHYAASARVLAMVQQGEVNGVFPAHGFTTLYYLVRKHATRPDAEAAMDDVLRYFEVGNLEAAGWARARALPMTDFEDAVVAVVAEETASEFIITRNTGDFTHSPVPAITPVEFLSQFAPS